MTQYDIGLRHRLQIDFDATMYEQQLRENILITNLEVTNRYLVSYVVDVLDH